MSIVSESRARGEKNKKLSKNKVKRERRKNNQKKINSTSVSHYRSSRAVMIFLVFALVAVIAVIYLYLTWNFNYWHNLGIPAPKDTRILVGDFPNSISRKKHNFYDFDAIYT